MKAIDYPEPFLALVRELRRLPSVGPRSAERIALWLLSSPDAKPLALAEAVNAASDTVQSCECCGFFSVTPRCVICEDAERAGRAICVVETATDILPIERTGIFNGRFHALGGRLAPLDNIGPEDLRIDVLIDRVQSEMPTEVILALSADVEGEATANYIAELLSDYQVPVTRIAQGLPAGGGLEHADQLTLQRAMTGRRVLG